MKSIPLDKGMVALIDDEDFELVSQFHWWAWRARDGTYYAKMSTHKGGKDFSVFMHVLIAGRDAPHIDHWNGQTLDNRRFNLRPCSCSQNIANSKKFKSNTSGFKGVSRIRDKWRAYIGDKACGSWEHLGHFPTPEEAAKAYDDAAIRKYGAFARTNASMGLLDHEAN